MKYGHILSYVTRAVWAIDPDKLEDILSVLAFRAAGGVFTKEEIQARIGDPTPSAANIRGAIAVIPIRGTIANRMGAMDESSGGMSIDRFRGMFRQALSNDAVGSILLDVDSPGGTVIGVPEMAAEIYAARGQKPIVAHVNGMAASAAYWLVASADEIVAAPSSMVGSIGVFLAREDVSEALEKAGVKVTIISAGKFKAESLPFQPMSDAEHADKKALVKGFYDQFAKSVAKGRGVSVETVKNGFGEGRAVTSEQALAEGMIDRIASLDDTIVQMAGGGKRSHALRAEGDELRLVAADGAIANPDLALGQITDNDADADRYRRFRVQ